MRSLALAATLFVLLGAVVALQMSAWDAIGDLGADHALQDVAAAQAIGRLDGVVASLPTGGEMDDAMLAHAAEQLDTALTLVEDALQTYEIRSQAQADTLTTARDEAAAVRATFDLAVAAADADARTRHLIGVGVHVFELRRAQGTLAWARQQQTARIRTTGRLTTFALIGGMLLCLPLGFAGARTRPTAPAATTGAPSSDPTA